MLAWRVGTSLLPGSLQFSLYLVLDVSSIQSAVLTGRPRKEIELLPKKGILSSEMDTCGLVHCPA